MSKTILFARHAESTWDNPDWTDLTRPLTPRGFQDAAQMAAHLLDHAARPEIVLHSPAQRTTTTATFYAKVFGLAENAQILTENIYEAQPNTLWHIVQNLDNQYHTVLIVGHNPAMSYLLHDCGTEEYYTDLPPCGVFQVRFAVDNWQAAMPQTAFLEHIFTPNSLQ
jgi:phosphohistidine phosphatase